MQINDETVRASRAVKQLMDLSDAYRASSRAHSLVLARISNAIDSNTGVPLEKRTLDRAMLEQQKAHAVAQEGVFSVRRDQLRRRLLDLQGIPELS